MTDLTGRDGIVGPAPVEEAVREVSDTTLRAVI
jgi:hypothetical protein